MSINLLPCELLRAVFEDLSNDDIINLPYSVSCNGLTVAEVHRRFSTIYRHIWINEGSLQTLIRASRHPLIGPTIKELHFDLDRLAEVSEHQFRETHQKDHCKAEEAWDAPEEREHPKSYQQDILAHWPCSLDQNHTGPCQISRRRRVTMDHKTSEGSSSNRHTNDVKMRSVAMECCTEEAMNRKWAHYLQAYQAQSYMAHNELDAKLLARAFESLSSVTTIMFANCWHSGTGWSGKLVALLGDSLCFDCVYLPDEGSGAYLIEVISKALAASGLKLRQILVESDGGLAGGCCSLDFARLRRIIPAKVCQDMFRHLVVLKLKSLYYSLEDIRKYQRWRELDEGDTAEWGYESEDSEDATRESLNEDMQKGGKKHRSNYALRRNGTTKALASILSSCPFIEELALCFVDDYTDHMCRELMPHIPLQKMLGESNELSRLRKLKLGNCRMEEDQLVGTLLLCAPTLEELRLDEFILDRGTWESAMNILQGRFPRLGYSEKEFGYLYFMGDEMETLCKSYGIKPVWEYRYPQELYLSARKMLKWMNGKSAVNPMRAYMLRWAEKTYPDYHGHDSMEGGDSDPSEPDTS